MTFGVTSPYNTTSTVVDLIPTAEDLAAQNTASLDFSATYELGDLLTGQPFPTIPPNYQSTPVYMGGSATFNEATGVYVTDTGDVQTETQTQTEIPPVNNNPVIAFLKDEKNKPYVIAGGALLAVAAVYYLSKNKKGGKK